jgi:hypothetical protein
MRCKFMKFFHIVFQQKAATGFMGYTENCIYGLEQYGWKSELTDNIWESLVSTETVNQFMGYMGKPCLNQDLLWTDMFENSNYIYLEISYVALMNGIVWWSNLIFFN